MSRFSWSPERVQALKDMLAADHAGVEIAAFLGCSKNALRVKMNKLGLKVSAEALRRVHAERQTRKWRDNRDVMVASIQRAWDGAEERRAKAAERARLQRAQGRCGLGPTPEQAAKIADSLRRFHAKRRAAAERASVVVIHSPTLEAQAGIVRSAGTMQPPAGYAAYRQKLPPVRTMFEAR